MYIHKYGENGKDAVIHTAAAHTVVAGDDALYLCGLVFYFWKEAFGVEWVKIQYMHSICFYFLFDIFKI